MRILYIDIDTLRADHLGCYGYHRNTSPHIDSIAAEGVCFDNYYCADAPCLPSRTGLATGRFGITTGVVGHGGTAADHRLEGSDRGFRSRLSTETLTGMLRGAGFHTTLISPFAERHGTWGFYAGFNEIYNTGKGGMESAEEISPVALDWIDRRGHEDNWFLHVNYWDPHTPYRAPAEVGNPFVDEPIPSWITPEVLANHRRMAGPHKAREISMFDNASLPAYPRHLGEIRDMDDLRRHFDGYDTGIRYADDHVGRLIAALKAKGVWDDVLVVVSSDHGENQGELGIYAEHGTADQATTRIPCIIRWPKRINPATPTKPGTHRSALHYQLDLAPTLAEVLGQPIPEVWEGSSFASSLVGDRDEGHDQLVISQNAHVCQRSVRFGPYLYMRTYHDGYHELPREMVFDIVKDPHEQNDLAAERPDLLAEGARRLTLWHQDRMKNSPNGIDPMETVLQEGGPHHARGNLSRYLEFLRKTDRGEAAERLAAAHPDEL